MNRKILVAPLNWGLGHASRSIPIIKALLEYNFEPIIASDGVALELLSREFPKLSSEELPAYNISYSKNPAFFKLKMFTQMPHILRTISEEKRILDQLMIKYDLCGIISDNRWGMYHRSIPSVIITHQLNVLTGITTSLSSLHHQQLLKKFDECWVPDFEDPENNLSGKLAHGKFSGLNLKYLGALSRFSKNELEEKYDIIIVLSGPEPQRGILEEILLEKLKDFRGRICLVRGTSEKAKLKYPQNWEFNAILTSEELNQKINESKLVLARSGYTTVMDLAKLEKKCFLIPTPGQEEQEYLAQYLSEQNLVGTCSQREFTVDKLKNARSLKGIFPNDLRSNLPDLFALFERE